MKKQDRPAVRDEARNTADADTAVYLGCPDLDAVYFFLGKKRVALDKPVITSYGWKAIYVHDPDNYCRAYIGHTIAGSRHNQYNFH